MICNNQFIRCFINTKLSCDKTTKQLIIASVNAKDSILVLFDNTIIEDTEINRNKYAHQGYVISHRECCVIPITCLTNNARLYKNRARIVHNGINASTLKAPEKKSARKESERDIFEMCKGTRQRKKSSGGAFTPNPKLKGMGTQSMHEYEHDYMIEKRIHVRIAK